MDISRLIRVASGAEKADFVIKNATVADVLNGRFVKGDVAFAGEFIAGVGTYEGRTETDGYGKFVMPSMYDTHLHFESVMLRPSEYLKAAVPRGVTAFNADPHEIANVCGEQGIRFMVNDTKDVPADVRFMMPSCVPAAPEDSTGCTIDSRDVHLISDKLGLFGLGEMMNYPGVIAADEEVLKKLQGFGIIDGHAPMLGGNALNAYIASGVMTDHECESAEEALEKTGKGLYVMLRGGSQARNLGKVIKAVNKHNLRRFLFCTDDINTETLLGVGTIGNCVRIAVESGLQPIEAMTIATLNAYEAYGDRKRGAVAPGYYATIIVCGDDMAQDVKSVYYKGELVAADGKPLFDVSKADASAVKDTVNFKPFRADELRLPFKQGMPVICVNPGTLITTSERAHSPDGLNLMCCIERHHATGEIGRCYVRGFGLKDCAIAQTVGHDSHNITVLGDNAEDMAKAVESLGKGGGLSVVRHGEVAAYLPLDIGGLMSDASADEVLALRKKLNEALNGVPHNRDIEPFMLLSFLSLIVIPEVRLNTKGLFDVTHMRYLYKG